jgi:hypothetical protein
MFVKVLYVVLGHVSGYFFHRWWIDPDIKNMKQELAKYKAMTDRNK